MINIRVAEKPANSSNQRCQMFQEQIISFPETDNEQESVPVGCVPHACQPHMFWLLPLGVSIGGGLRVPQVPCPEWVGMDIPWDLEYPPMDIPTPLVTPGGHHWTYNPPPWTDTRENITFPQLRLRVVATSRAF